MSERCLVSEPIRLRVRGARACFTRPEFHVERVSYPVISPSAARGVLEAILMKPIEKPETAKRDDKSGFRWRVTRIGIVHEGVFASVLRNELGYTSHNFEGFNASDPKKVRAQRHSLILTGTEDETGAMRPLEYLIEAMIEVPYKHARGKHEFPIATYQRMFERRARKGQYFHRPYFGCREFPCDFELAPDAEPDVRINRDYGRMMCDFDFSPVWDFWQSGKPRPVKWEQNGERVKPRPYSFHAVAHEGWIKVDPNERKENGR